MWPLLIFDLDGTLIDSAEDISSALNKTLAHYDKPPLSHEIVVAHIGEGLRKLLADFFPAQAQDPQLYRPIEEMFLRTYEEEMYKTTRPFPGVMDFLSSYSGKLAIVTNKNEAPAHRILKHLGMWDLPWTSVYGADSLIEKKPHPLPLLEAMKKAGTSVKNSIMIGDGTPDMRAAQNAGIPSIAIEFGYTKLEILQKYKPIATLKHYKDLKNLVHQLINH